MTNILLIEDNLKLSNNIIDYLTLEKCKVDHANTGSEGLDKALKNNYDIIILDINLPYKDGFEICETLRNRGVSIPILFLTAQNSKKDVIQGLKIGADDYFSKPFDMNELLARIESLVRRSHNTFRIQKIGNITINTSTQKVLKDDIQITLSPKEYQLLEYLVFHKGKIISHCEIIEKVWHEYDQLMFSRTVDVHIAYLRKKLGKEIIQTIKSQGYTIS